MNKLERDRLAHTVKMYLQYGFVNELAAYYPYRSLSLSPLASDRLEAVRKRIIYAPEYGLTTMIVAILSWEVYVAERDKDLGLNIKGWSFDRIIEDEIP